MAERTPSRLSDLPRRKSPRLPGFTYHETHAYSVTICTRDRTPHFAAESVGREVAHCLEEQAAQCGYTLVCYCIMPDHVHILTAPSMTEGAIPLPQFIRQFKSAATHRLGKLGIAKEIWQRSFYDHVLRKDEDLERVASYILANPVRKGLAQAPEAYPLSGYFPENCRT